MNYIALQTLLRREYEVMVVNTISNILTKTCASKIVCFAFYRHKQDKYKDILKLNTYSFYFTRSCGRVV